MNQLKCRFYINRNHQAGSIGIAEVLSVEEFQKLIKDWDMSRDNKDNFIVEGKTIVVEGSEYVVDWVRLQYVEDEITITVMVDSKT